MNVTPGFTLDAYELYAAAVLAVDPKGAPAGSSITAGKLTQSGCCGIVTVTGSLLLVIVTVVCGPGCSMPYGVSGAVAYCGYGTIGFIFP